MNAEKEKNYKDERERMVYEQLIKRGIADKRVLETFMKVPRHSFVPQSRIDEAYGDYPVGIGEGQTISQPYMVALMSERVEPKKTDTVLEIGTGSGYQTAILAELVRQVYTVERIFALAERAQNILKDLGYDNVKFKTGDGSLGWEEFAPYDGIIITCAAPFVPAELKAQLKEGGRLVMPIGASFSQTLVVVRNKKGTFTEEEVCGCVFVPLVGKAGFNKDA